jgi:hypothetical protein
MKALRSVLRPLGPLGLLAAALGLTGCGHPMSSDECDQFINKVIELELDKQNVHDPATVEQRKKDVIAARGKDLTQGCVGRKVTDSAMRCVRAAKSYDEIENVCLR